MAHLLWILILSGCDGGPEDSGPVAADDTGDAAGLVLPDPEPGWTAEEVQAILQEALDLGPPDLNAIRTDYLAMLAGGDADCPGEGATYLGGSVPVEGCTASTGYSYIGVSSYQWGQGDVEVEGFPGIETSWLIDGDFEMADASGARFAGGGEIFTYHAEVFLEKGNSYRFGIAELLGTWIDERSGGSAARGISGALTFNVTEDDTHEEVSLDGVLSVGGVSLEFDELAWHSVDCAEQANGAIKLRDDVGYWYTLELDADCSGCGRLIFEDAYNLWDVCLEIQPFMLAALAGITP